ncbi:MAG: hypothetical protein HUU32_19590 [Calditrichaceae bacterium]|nr:DUF6337 family protein [Calditrichia bacterium]NUQ43600.1 hypothetical protein [Calditrichaceae bacterium]
MINFLSSLVLLLAVFGLTVFERRHLNNLFTPFTVTAWPFAIISILVNTVVVKMDFLPVSARANFFILLNLLIIWLVGFLLSHTYKPEIKTTNFVDQFKKYKDFRSFLLMLSWIVIVVVGYRVFSILAKEGWQFIGDDRFERMMIVGLPAHFALLGKVLLIFLILILWKSKKSLLDYLTMAFLTVSIMSLMVKYHIVWVVLIVFFVVNMGLTPKLQLRKVGFIVSMVMAIFIANYLILFLSWQTLSFFDARLWKFILGWMVNYLMTGPIMLEHWMNMSFTKPWWALFIVPINFKNVILGDPERLSTVKYVSPGFIPVSPDFDSNVGTSFGVYYLIGGFAFTILLTIIIALISYILYFRGFKSNNPVTTFFAAFFLMLGTLSFFVQYFTLLSLYELPVVYMIILGILHLLYKIKTANSGKGVPISGH